MILGVLIFTVPGLSLVLVGCLLIAQALRERKEKL